ncbi:MAG: hypothetical protein NVSMB23_19030 [Myxococcales bacterium]
MKPARIPTREARPGLVLARDVRTGGVTALGRGRLLSADDAALLRGLPDGELHVIELAPGDLHEDPAGSRLAAAAAGEGVEAMPPVGGAFPLLARQRGIVEIDAGRLAQVNEIEDLIVATLPHGQIATEGEVVARAKVIPFVTRADRVARAEEAARPGVVRVRAFVPLRVVAVVEDRLEASVLARFGADFGEKVRFFGSQLVSVDLAGGSAEALAAALTSAVARGAQLVVLAGGRPMDPLDPALQALDRAGGRLLKHGIPAHPGALLWLGALGAVPVVGVPSCGIASKATALDLLMPRLFCGGQPSLRELAELGAGGLLTRESAFRLPPYRRPGTRGELDGS